MANLRYENVMAEVFGFDNFKSGKQEEAFLKIMEGHKNIIISLKSFGGKSLCYQLAGIMQKDRLTIVISPSLALIKNQVDYLNDINSRTGFNVQAATINSKVQGDEREDIIDRLLNSSEIKFLFVTPEILAFGRRILDLVKDLACNGKIFQIVIDNDVKDRGYRPDINSLKKIRRDNANIPWIVLMTGSPAMILKAEEEYGMRETMIVKDSSVREDIFYCVRPSNEAIKIISLIQDQAVEGKIPSGIIYVNSCEAADTWEKILVLNGIQAKPYYASIEGRDAIYDEWMSETYPVLIATTESFGYGIVKVPLHFVYHVDSPSSLLSFYQESGRANLNGAKVISTIFSSGHGLTLGYNQMEDFISTKSCRRVMIATSFGERVEKCGDMCDNCLNEVHLAALNEAI